MVEISANQKDSALYSLKMITQGFALVFHVFMMNIHCSVRFMSLSSLVFGCSVISCACVHCLSHEGPACALIHFVWCMQLYQLALVCHCNLIPLWIALME